MRNLLNRRLKIYVSVLIMEFLGFTVKPESSSPLFGCIRASLSPSISPPTRVPLALPLIELHGVEAVVVVESVVVFGGSVVVTLMVVFGPG
ncbi:hypothetical protein L1887_38879 [Cichorium endivia]|nr:hypothetical protein L1887_38879 [Cichorium endivia]